MVQKTLIKLISFIIIISFIIPSLLVPLKTKAFLGFGDIVTDPAHTIVNAMGWTAEKVGKGIVRALAKKILDKIADQLIQSIREGGKPQFITNFNRFLEEAADEAGGALASAFFGPGFDICSPFMPFIRINLSKWKFDQAVRCKISDIIKNYQKVGEEIAKGNWDYWFRINEISGNPYGAGLYSLEKILLEMAKKEEEAKTEAIANKGFVGDKICRQLGYDVVIYNDETGNTVYDKIFANTKEEAQKIKNDWEKGGAPKVTIQTSSKCAEGHGEIVTPGSFIGDAVAKAGLKDIDWLISAREIEDYIIAITDAFVYRMQKETIQGAKNLLTGGKAKAGLAYASLGNYSSSQNPNIGGFSGTKLSPSSITSQIRSTIKDIDMNINHLIDLFHVTLLNYFAYQHIPSTAVAWSTPTIGDVGAENLDYGDAGIDITENGMKKGLQLLYYSYFKPRIEKKWVQLSQINDQIITLRDQKDKLQKALDDLTKQIKHLEFELKIPIKQLSIYFDGDRYTIDENYDTYKILIKDDLNPQEISDALNKINEFENDCRDFISYYEDNKFDEEKLYFYIKPQLNISTSTEIISKELFDDSNLLTPLSESKLSFKNLPNCSPLYNGPATENYLKEKLSKVKLEYYQLDENGNYKLDGSGNKKIFETSQDYHVYRDDIRQLIIKYQIILNAKSQILKYLQKLQMITQEASSNISSEADLVEQILDEIKLFNGEAGDWTLPNGQKIAGGKLQGDLVAKYFLDIRDPYEAPFNGKDARYTRLIYYPNKHDNNNNGNPGDDMDTWYLCDNKFYSKEGALFKYAHCNLEISVRKDYDLYNSGQPVEVKLLSLDKNPDQRYIEIPVANNPGDRNYALYNENVDKNYKWPDYNDGNNKNDSFKFIDINKFGINLNPKDKASDEKQDYDVQIWAAASFALRQFADQKISWPITFNEPLIAQDINLGKKSGFLNPDGPKTEWDYWVMTSNMTENGWDLKVLYQLLKIK